MTSKPLWYTKKAQFYLHDQPLQHFPVGGCLCVWVMGFSKRRWASVEPSETRYNLINRRLRRCKISACSDSWHRPRKEPHRSGIKTDMILAISTSSVASNEAVGHVSRSTTYIARQYSASTLDGHEVFEFDKGLNSFNYEKETDYR